MAEHSFSEAAKEYLIDPDAKSNTRVYAYDLRTAANRQKALESDGNDPSIRREYFYGATLPCKNANDRYYLNKNGWSSQKELDDFLRQESKTVKYTCTFCEEDFPSRNECREHMKGCEKQPEPDNVCTYCDPPKNFGPGKEAKKKLQGHIIGSHKRASTSTEFPSGMKTSGDA